MSSSITSRGLNRAGGYFPGLAFPCLASTFSPCRCGQLKRSVWLQSFVWRACTVFLVLDIRILDEEELAACRMHAQKRAMLLML